MPNLIQVTAGTQICIADHAGDFAPTAANDLQQGTPTDVEAALASLADGSYYQSAKFDFGTDWAQEYDILVAIEFAATPTDGEPVYFYFGPSPDGTAANGNVGGLSGSKGAYTGYSSNASSAIKQLEYVGVMFATVQATTTVQIAHAGRFRPSCRYGSLVVQNESGAAFHSDDVETHIVLNPVEIEVQ